MKLSKSLLICISIAISSILYSCESVDDSRIPYCAVYIDLGNLDYWGLYGVHYLGDSNRFIKSKRIPSNFPYNLTTETGFGGVLIVGGIDNTPLAYDLACPVEVKSTVLVNYDENTRIATCPICHSEYDVCEYQGSPISGEAKRRKWGLRRYQAVPAIDGGYKIRQR
ncbi:MAG: hypothetical protein NC343_04780 [Muribaculum sp.]|nr:hypothetical protein [Muribaculaceae bacterium]MCM1081047.1 hypothetical protein [Muribaculum sp.]